MWVKPEAVRSVTMACFEYLRRAEGRADVVLEALRHRPDGDGSVRGRVRPRRRGRRAAEQKSASGRAAQVGAPGGRRPRAAARASGRRARSPQDRSRLPGRPLRSACRRRAAASRGGRRPRAAARADADELPVGAPDRRAAGRANVILSRLVSCVVFDGTPIKI